MKSSIFAAVLMIALVIVSISNLHGDIQDGDQPVNQNSPQLAVQDEAPSAPPQPDVPPALETTQESPSDAPLVDAPVVEEYVPESVLQSAPMMLSAEIACGACCCQRCCCPPCPAQTTFCIVDPCTGCSYEVCADVPACCVGQAPVVTWRGGLFGRKIAQLCWPCCNKRVKVVVMKHGKVRVRG